MKTATKLQKKMLIELARNEYTPLNGEEPKKASDCETWTDELINTAQDKGVWVSLLNAELIIGSGGREGYTRMTDKGFEIYKQIVQS